MQDTSQEIAELRAAHDRYRQLLDRIKRIVARHPNGLGLRPLFGQGGQARRTPPEAAR